MKNLDLNPHVSYNVGNGQKRAHYEIIITIRRITP